MAVIAKIDAGLVDESSSDIPYRAAVFEKCRERESNSRHQVFQTCALPTELSRRLTLAFSGFARMTPVGWPSVGPSHMGDGHPGRRRPYSPCRLHPLEDGTGSGRLAPDIARFMPHQRGQVTVPVFLFFSSRMGCGLSVLVSVIVTLFLLAACGELHLISSHLS